MKQVERVWAELSASKKFELSAIDDLKKAIAQSEKIESKTKQEMKDLQKRYEDYIRSVFAFEDATLGPIGKTVQELKSKIDAAERAAKQLGMSANDVPSIKAAKQKLQVIDDLWSDASEAFREAKQF
jgi:archaellum component FlaC